MRELKTDINGTRELLSLFNGHDIHLLKQVCVTEGDHLILKIKEGRVSLKGNGAALAESLREPLTDKLREFTELLTDRATYYRKDGSIRRPPERKAGLTGTIKLFLSKTGGIDRTRYIVGDTLIENGFIVPRQA